MERAALTLLLPVLLATACAGKAPDPTKAAVKPRVDVGHGSVEEVYGKLIENDALCNNLEMVFPPLDSEQTATCEIGGGEALVVHYNVADEAVRFEERVRTEGGHGVFSDSWGMRLPDAATAERVAQALGVSNRTSG